MVRVANTVDLLTAQPLEENKGILTNSWPCHRSGSTIPDQSVPESRPKIVCPRAIPAAYNWKSHFPGRLKAIDVINLPSIALLELRHAFPCLYTFKVIGFADENFTARVLASVRDELQIENDPPFSLRNTAHGRHVAVTLEPLCASSQQVLAIYSRLSGLDGLVMLL